MTTAALRWGRRALDALLVGAALVVIVTAGFAVLAPVLGGRSLVIGGGSMEPAIPRGALVLVLPSEAPYAVGDIVTVQQGAATPYTHRITRLTELDSVPYVETKGDANAAADPVIVPAAAIEGRVVVSIPLLGYVSALLATGLGLAAFLTLGAGALLASWVLGDLEEERCPACAAGATPGLAASGTIAAVAAGLGTLAPAGILGGLPAFAVPRPRTRVRERGRARAPETPVLLERDRRNPFRHGLATAPALPGVEPAEPAAAADPAEPAGERNGTAAIPAELAA